MLRVIGAALITIALAALCWLAASTGGDSVAVPLAYRAADVPLVAVNGRSTRLASGPRLVVFGYVGCAERCTITLRILSTAVAKERAAHASRVTFVDINPWQDTRTAIAAYIANFPGVEAVTGSPAALVANEVALGMQPVIRPADVTGHDTRIFVVDAGGVLVRVLNPQVTVEGVRLLLRTSPKRTRVGLL